MDKAQGIYHALNRRNARRTLLRKEEDYRAFVRTLAEGLEKYPIQLFSFRLMPNHWHLVLSPREDGVMRLSRWPIRRSPD